MFSVKINAEAFAPKVYWRCKTAEEARAVVAELKGQGHRFRGDPQKVEASRGGVIVALCPTLMTWGDVRLIPNTPFRINRLQQRGFVEKGEG